MENNPEPNQEQPEGFDLEAEVERIRRINRSAREHAKLVVGTVLAPLIVAASIKGYQAVRHRSDGESSGTAEGSSDNS